MTQTTPDGSDRPVKIEEPQTLLQWPGAQSPDVLQTGIQASSGGPRLEVGPVPLTRVANYELIKEVGRGGMGVVFKARDVRLNRIVALKMIRDKALANPDELQRFEKEAAAAAQLKHPNIVALHDFDRYNDQPFLSMEFIGGTSLAERVSMGPLSGRRAAEYLELTARAVHYAHTKGIIHRDLKPANVLLDEDDQPKVTDFGLAKQMEANSDQTRTGAVLGTPSYMSPEQATGSKAISPSSDIYSLGAILYELLTGKPPFAGETPLKTLNLVCEQDPIMPRLLNPSVDRELETICLKCLEKSPSRRYDSAESLADDLHRFLQGEPITARRVSIVGRGVKWCRRHQWETIVGSAIVVTIAAFIGFLLYDARVADNLRQEAVEAKNQSADRFSTMRSLFYLSQMRQAHQTLRRADLEGVERIIDHWAFNANQADLRDWEWYFLKEQCQHRLAFSTHQGRAFAVAYRPDGKQLATAGGELNKPGEIKVLEARTGKLLHTLQGHTNVVTAVAYHPTKNLLASASYDQTIKLWDLNTGTGIQTLRGHTSYVYHVAFSPKGDRLASASEDHTVRLWDWERYAREPAESAKKLAGQDGHDGPVTAVAFHPELDLLASASRDRTVKLWSVSTGQLEKTWSEHVGPVETLAFTPNGKTLVSGGGRGSQRGEVLFSDVDTGKVRDARYGLSDRVQHLAISPDGKVAAGCGDGVVRVWNKGLSSEALSFRADPLSVSGVAFAPDGFTLASAGRSGRISLWNSSAGLETLTLPALGAMETVAFNPKGRYLAAAGGPRGDVRVWNLDSPDHPIVDKGHKGAVFALAFSPDGQTLASGGEDRVVRLVDFLHPDNAPTLLPGHKARIHAMAYRPDGMMLASADDDDAILLHDLAAGKPPTILLGQTKGVLCLAFSPDGQYLASGGFDKTIRLWDLKTGKNYALESHGNSINALAFNHDGSVLASASNDKTIRVWDVAKRKEEFKLEGTPGPVQSLAFHPGGRRLVSIGQDRMIRLWDFVTRQEILEFEEHLGTLRSVAFSADGRSLAGAGNGVVRVWQASKEMPSERR